MSIEVMPAEYRHGETLLEGIAAFDTTTEKPRPVVLVAHAWGGRDEFAIQKARDLAQLGYVDLPSIFMAKVFWVQARKKISH